VSTLSGKRILVVEDEPIIALSLEDVLSGFGAEVVGPVSAVEPALALIADNGLDGALLDVNLAGERCDRVAARLSAEGVPFVLATGYGVEARETFPGAPVLCKPYRDEDIERELTRALAGPAGDA